MQTSSDDERPALTPALTGSQLRRWYWTVDELSGLARQLGVPTRGGKANLLDRLACVLDGHTPPSPPDRARPVGHQLRPPVTRHTVIPPGQRCSQVLREFFVAEIGPTFHFDAAMREFIAGGAGRTLGEAIKCWHATRSDATREIAPQFEYNRFTRQWHQNNPHGTPAQARAAWHAHRSRPKSLPSSPADEGRVGEESA